MKQDDLLQNTLESVERHLSINMPYTDLKNQLQIYGESVMRDLALHIKQNLYCEQIPDIEETVKFTFEVPKNLLEHFKMLYFPEFLLDRFPVKTYCILREKKVVVRLKKAYPNLNHVYQEKLVPFWFTDGVKIKD